MHKKVILQNYAQKILNQIFLSIGNWEAKTKLIMKKILEIKTFLVHT